MKTVKDYLKFVQDTRSAAESRKLAREWGVLEQSKWDDDLLGMGLLEFLDFIGEPVPPDADVQLAVEDDPIPEGEEDVYRGPPPEGQPEGGNRIYGVSLIPDLVGRAAGTAAGVAEEGAKLLSGAASAVPGVPIVPGAKAIPAGEGPATQTEAMFGEQEKDFQKIMDRSVGTEVSSMLTSNLAHDLSDNITGILHLLGMAIGADLSDERMRKKAADRLRLGYQEGKDLGGMLVGGTIGGTVAFLANPKQAIVTRPFSTLMMLVPQLKAAQLAGKSALLNPKLARLVALGEKLKELGAKEVATLPGEQRVRGYARGKVEGLKEGTQEFRAAVHRYLSDPTAQVTPEEAVVVENMLYKGDRRKAVVESAIKEMSGQLRAGNILPSEVLTRAPDRTVAPGTIELIESIRQDPTLHPADKLVDMGTVWEHSTSETNKLDLSFPDAEYVVSEFMNEYTNTQGHRAMAVMTDKATAELLREQLQATASKDEAYQLSQQIMDVERRLLLEGEAERLYANMAMRHHTRMVPRIGEPYTESSFTYRLQVPKDGGPLQMAEDLAASIDAIEADPAMAHFAIRQVLPPELVKMMEARTAAKAAPAAPAGAQAGVPAGVLAPTPPMAKVKFHQAKELTGQLKQGKVLATMGKPDIKADVLLPSTDHPVWGPLADDVTRVMRSSREMRRTALVQEPWRAAPLRGIDNVNTFAPMPLQSHEIQGALASVLRNESSQLLRSAKGRKVIVDRILAKPDKNNPVFRERPQLYEKRLKKWKMLTHPKTGLTRKRLDTLLMDMGETNLLDHAFDYEIVLQDPDLLANVNKMAQEAGDDAGKAALFEEGIFSLDELDDMPAEDAQVFRAMYETARDEAIEDHKQSIDGVAGYRPGLRLADEAKEAFTELAEQNPKVMNKVRAEALESVGKVLADSVATSTTTELIAKELARFKHAGEDLGKYAIAMAKDVLVNGMHKPLALRKHHPSEIARYLQTRSKDIAGNLEVDEQRLLRFARDVNQGYTAPDPALNQLLLPINKGALEDMPPHVPVLQSQMASSVQAVSKGFNDTFAWQLKAQKAIELADSRLDKLLRAYKGNLTVMNLASHKNNFLANLGYRSMQAGTDPITQLMRMGKAGHIYLKFLRGEITDPDLLRTMRAIDRSGLLDTTLLEGEIGGMGKAGLLGDELQRDSVLGRSLETFQNMTRVTKTRAGQLYRLGDNLFKLDMALQNMGKLRGKMNSLEVGRYIEFPVDETRVARITMDAPGEPSLAVRRVGQRFENAKQMSPAHIEEMLARGAGKPAQDVFFDYGRVPLALQVLRSSKMGGLVSPYLTWAWKALDIPGMKRGLLTNILGGDGGVSVKTNSAALNAMQATEAAATSMRRSFVVNGLRNHVNSLNDRDTRDLVKWAGKEAGIGLIETLTDPRYLDFSNMQQTNWAAPTESLFRIGLGAYLATTGGGITEYYKGQPKTTELEAQASKYAEDDPRRRELLETVNRRKLWLKHLTGETWNVEDALALAGMSGSPLVEFLFETKKADETGGEKAWRRAFNSGAALLIGATPAAGVDIGLGLLAKTDTGPLADFAALSSTRKWSVSKDDATLTQPFSAWMMKRIVGLGWRKAKGRTAKERYLVKAEKALRGSLLTAKQDRLHLLKAELLSARTAGDHKEARLIATRMADLAAAITTLDGVVVDEVQSLRNRYGNFTERLMGKNKGGSK